MREMTREELCRLIRRHSYSYGGLTAYARQHRVSISTLSNMIHGRNRFTPKVLRLLGLEHVRVVEGHDGPVAAEPVPVGRSSRPMWRLGDWPSRYRVTEVA